MKDLKVKGDQVNSIAEHLKQGGKVKATRLGIFKVISVKGKAWNIATKKMANREYRKVKFVATKSIKQALND